MGERQLLGENEDDQQRQRDIESREIIVNQQPGWQRTYKELLIDQYGKIVYETARYFGPQNLELGEPEDLHNLLLEYLHGNGTWRHLRSWDPQKGPFGPWLYMVVRNLCKARLTQEQRHAARQSSPDASRSDDAGEAIPWEELIEDPRSKDDEEKVLWQMVIPLLMEALQRLDGESQDILFYSFWLGLSDGEIGTRLGQRRETVNKKKNEAVRKLLYLLTAGYHHLDKTSQDVLRRYYHDGETEHRISQTLKLTDEEVSQRRLAALITLQDIIKGDLPND